MDLIKLLIVDDDEQICESIKIILSKDAQIEVLGFAHTGEQAISQFLKLKPDLVLMDIRMPELSGIEASKRIMQEDETAKILLLSTFSDEEYIIKAFQVGVRGYIIKQNYKEIAPAIKAAINGQFVFADEVINTIPKFISRSTNASIPHSENSNTKAGSKKDKAEGLKTTDDNRSSSQNLDYDLNPKELDIIRLVALGMTNQEIAEELHFSKGTIRNYISSLLDKLDLKNRTQLASFYVDFIESE